MAKQNHKIKPGYFVDKLLDLDRLILEQARENPASLLPKCRSAICEMPSACVHLYKCQYAIGISKALDYMKRAGLTKDQITEAFEKAYSDKGLFDTDEGLLTGKKLAEFYLGEQ